MKPRSNEWSKFASRYPVKAPKPARRSVFRRFVFFRMLKRALVSMWEEYWGVVPEHIFLRRYIKRGDVVIDAGANIGRYARFFLLCGARVYAFEPGRVFSELVENVRNRRATLYKIALGDWSGLLELYENVVPSRTSAYPEIGAEGRVIVPVYRLDEFEFEPVRFLKIDVEGMDYQVLRGAVELLKRDRPIVFVEYDRDRDKILRFMGRLGYDGLIVPFNDILFIHKDDPCKDF